MINIFIMSHMGFHKILYINLYISAVKKLWLHLKEQSTKLLMPYLKFRSTFFHV